MSDIVERLRDYGSNPMVQSEYSMVPARELLEAADEIERLRGLLLESWEYVGCPTELWDRIREALGE